MDKLIYNVLYNLAVVMFGVLFAGMAYGSAVLMFFTDGPLRALFSFTMVCSVLLFIAYIIDCIPQRKKRRGKRKAAHRAGTR